MPRNLYTEQIASRETFMNGTSQGAISVVGSARNIERPDIIRNTAIGGWRRPTGWRVLDEQVALGFTGEISYDVFGTSIRIKGNTSGSIGPRRIYPTLPDLNTAFRAEVECLNKIQDQKVNLALMAAEARTTISMVADRVIKLAGAYKQVRQGNLAGALRTLGYAKKVGGKLRPSGRGAASDWLEMQYGWKPLLQDIHGAYEQAREGFESQGHIITAKRVLKQKYQTERDRENPNIEGYFDTTFEEVELLTKVSLSYYVSNSGLRAASKVGLTNPAVIAWELVPFSFLLDWLVPVGNWISALGAADGLTFKGGTMTRTGRTRQNVTLEGRGGRFKASGKGVAVSTSFLMERTVYLQSPRPVVHYKNPFSVGHALNALALLRVIFGGR